jgi:hypothetical protein
MFTGLKQQLSQPILRSAQQGLWTWQATALLETCPLRERGITFEEQPFVRGGQGPTPCCVAIRVGLIDCLGNVSAIFAAAIS